MSGARLLTGSVAAIASLVFVGGLASAGPHSVAADTCLGSPVTILGTAGPETLIGTSGPDVISGLGGNDAILGKGGADKICGGDGDDLLTGGNGADTEDGGYGIDSFEEESAPNGADTFSGGFGADWVNYVARSAALTVRIDDAANDGAAGENDNVKTDVENIRGGSGNDSLMGSVGVNSIIGGPGNDTLDGSSNNDTLTGGAGNDVLYGAEGNDTFEEDFGPNGADTFIGSGGNDAVRYKFRSTSLTLVIDNVANDGAANEGDNIRTDVENLYGGSGGDILTGSSIANLLDGGAGQDTITGGIGNDILIGREGDDLFPEGANPNGADVTFGGAGTDWVLYTGRSTPVTVTLTGLANNDGAAGEHDDVNPDVERVSGGSAADTLTGSSAANFLAGWGGNDTLNVLDGISGNDTVDGGFGTDICTADPGDTKFSCP